MDRIVSVALCTCNGERFLGEQLASLVGQTRLPSELVVCDDRSTDETIAILERFAATAPFPVHITVNAERLGPAANFAKAAALCTGDIVLFCDQDDIWHEDKMALEIAAITKAERNVGTGIPVLVHGDLEVVAEDLTPLYPSFMRLMHPKFGLFDTSYILENNVAVGCTMAVNRDLLKVALPLPKEALMHDWWFAQCATCCGSIVYLDRPLMLYRQHHSNQVGASAWLHRIAVALKSPRKQWRTSIESLRATVRQAKALESWLVGRNCTKQPDRDAVSAYAGLLGGGSVSRLHRILRHRYGRAGRLGVPWFLLKAIFA